MSAPGQGIRLVESEARMLSESERLQQLVRDAIAASPDVAAVRQRVADLHAGEIELSKQLIGLGSELGEREEALTDALYSVGMGGTVDIVNKALTQRGASVTRRDGLSLAIDRLRQQRSVAICALFVAEAQAVQDHATVLRSDVAQRMQKTEKLLADLHTHEGVLYVPAEHPRTNAGSPRVDRATWHGKHAKMTRTRSDELVRDAVRLERDAEWMAKRTPEGSGVVRVDSRDELLPAVEAWPIDKMGPRLDAVMLWLGEAFAEHARSGKYPVIGIECDWSQGTITRGAHLILDVPENAIGAPLMTIGNEQVAS